MQSPLRSGDPLPEAAEPAAQAAASPPSSARPALRPLTGWEEEFLEQHQFDANTARLCNEVVARCMTRPGGDHASERAQVRNMLVAERDRAVIELRLISLGPGVTAQADCTQCGQAAELSFSLDALAVDLPAVPRVVPAQIPGAPGARLRLPTAGDQEDLLDAEVDGESARLSWILGRCIILPDASDGTGTEFARDLPVAVRRQLQETLTRAVPELDLEMSVTCPHCGAGMTVPFDVQTFFFRIEPPGRRPVARRAPTRPGLPLERARHPRAAPRASTQISAVAGGGRRRGAVARSDHRRAGLIRAARPARVR
jgi:hypothetical protein